MTEAWTLGELMAAGAILQVNGRPDLAARLFDQANTLAPAETVEGAAD